jgi:hypothetical protein
MFTSCKLVLLLSVSLNLSVFGMDECSLDTSVKARRWNITLWIKPITGTHTFSIPKKSKTYVTTRSKTKDLDMDDR